MGKVISFVFIMILIPVFVQVFSDQISPVVNKWIYEYNSSSSDYSNKPDNKKEMSVSKEIAKEVNAIYRNILDREAKTIELQRYSQLIQQSWNYKQIRQELANSQECRTKLDGLIRSYCSTAPSSTLSLYIRKLANGDIIFSKIMGDVSRRCAEFSNSN